MDLMWWEIGGFWDGRLGLVLFGKLRERPNTPTIFALSFLNSSFARRKLRDMNDYNYDLETI